MLLWGAVLDHTPRHAANDDHAPTTCPIRFQGQWEDAETGLYYNRFRYYDPDATQYLSPDPLGLEGGVRPQAYVADPNSWIDPLGLQPCPKAIVEARVNELTNQIPQNSQGRITMGVAVAQDASGNRRTLISTSEPNGYLRPGVRLNDGEILVPGPKGSHAEVDIIRYAQDNNLSVISIGATRPVCAGCQAVIPDSIVIATPLK